MPLDLIKQCLNISHSTLIGRNPHLPIVLLQRKHHGSTATNRRSIYTNTNGCLHSFLKKSDKRQVQMYSILILEAKRDEYFMAATQCR